MKNVNFTPLSVVMIGATGAVGGETVSILLKNPLMERLTLLGRRPLADISHDSVLQHKIDIFKPNSYQEHLPGHRTAICTLGVGQPSKISKDDFVKIDKIAVLDFAAACKNAGVRHFELLASVGANAQSKSFYLRTKGELIEGLKELGFERLSIFQPSMILTPINRYGLSQAITLRLWPLLTPLLLGGLRCYRGISVELLGRAIALNLQRNKNGVEMLVWDDFMELNSQNIMSR